MIRENLYPFVKSVCRFRGGVRISRGIGWSPVGGICGIEKQSEVKPAIRARLWEVAVNFLATEDPFDEQNLPLESETKPSVAESHFVEAVITLHGFDIAELGKGFCCREFFKNEDLDVFTIRRGENREIFEEAFLEADVHSGFSSES